MGNKVHPKMFRTGVIYGWKAKWYANQKEYPKLLQEDTLLQNYLKKELKEASIDHIDIERKARALTVSIHSAKPGVIIGRGGTGIDELKKRIQKLLVKSRKLGMVKEGPVVNVNVVEVSRPNLSAEIVRQSMCAELERRMPFRRVLKTHLDRIQKAGAKGVKLQVKGRLNGAEIAREEKLAWGSVPLHNLRADIDYASGFARTIFGAIGVKVWIYRGDVFNGKMPEPEPPKPRFRGRPGGPRRGGPRR